MNQVTFKQKLALLIVALILVAGVFMVGSVSTRFQVTSTDPGNNKSINLYNVLILYYNEPINADKAQITSQPSFAFTKAVNNKELIIRPTNFFTNGTKYTVKINNVCAAKKPSSCTDHTLTFLADASVPESSQSDEQKKQIVAPVDAQYKDVPLTAILPVNETDFSIQAQPLGDFTYIVITPSVTTGSLTADEYNSLYAKYYQEGKDYLTGKHYALEGPKFKVVSSQEFAGSVTGGD